MTEELIFPHGSKAKAPPHLSAAFKALAVVRTPATRAKYERPIIDFVADPANDVNVGISLSRHANTPRSTLWRSLNGYFYGYPLFHLALVVGSPELISACLARDDLHPEYFVENVACRKMNYLGTLCHASLLRDKRDRRNPETYGLHPETVEAFRLLFSSGKIPCDLSKCGTFCANVIDAMGPSPYAPLVQSLEKQRGRLLVRPFMPQIKESFELAMSELKVRQRTRQRNEQSMLAQRDQGQARETDRAVHHVSESSQGRNSTLFDAAAGELCLKLPDLFDAVLENMLKAPSPAYGHIVLDERMLSPGTHNDTSAVVAENVAIGCLRRGVWAIINADSKFASDLTCELSPHQSELFRLSETVVQTMEMYWAKKMRAFKDPAASKAGLEIVALG